MRCVSRRRRRNWPNPCIQPGSPEGTARLLDASFSTNASPTNSLRDWPRSAAFDPVDKAVQAIAAGTPAAQLTTTGWTTHHWLHFLRTLPAQLDAAKMADLDATFHFSDTGNSEILSAWLLKVIDSHYEPAYPALERFLTAVGRRKYLKPLYAELAKTPAGAEMALRIYEKARPGYHSVSQKAVDEILGWRG